MLCIASSDYWDMMMDKSRVFFKKYSLIRKLSLICFIGVYVYLIFNYLIRVLPTVYYSDSSISGGFLGYYNSIDKSLLLYVIKLCVLLHFLHFIFKVSVGSVLTPQIWHSEQHFTSLDERDVGIRDFYYKESFFYVLMMMVWPCLLGMPIVLDGEVLVSLIGSYSDLNLRLLVVNIMFFCMAYNIPMILACWNAEEVKGAYFERMGYQQ